MNSEMSPLCWLGGTHAHIWWQCPQIQKFWKEVLGLIKKICGMEVKYDPWVCLFHGTTLSRKKYRLSLIPHLLNRAKAVIPKNWKKEKAPSVGEWLREVGRMGEMEEIWSIRNDCRPKYEEIWRGWGEFRRTETFISSLV